MQLFPGGARLYAGLGTAALVVSSLTLGGAPSAQASAQEADTGKRAANTERANSPTDAGTSAKSTGSGEPGSGEPGSGEPGSGEPGSIVSSAPSEFKITGGLPTNTEAWRVEYASTNATGEENTVSGMVIVPDDGKTEPRPLVTYAVGTVGMGDNCAPSATSPRGETTESILINNALLRGWAVAVTDYEGLGTPGDHTYTVGRAAGSAMLDAARAAQRLPEARQMGVSEESPVGIMGYSQGGQASAWAAEMHGSYAPDLDVKGTASGGVPADLRKVSEHINGGDKAGFLLMSAIGHDAVYPELKLESYLNDEGRKLTTMTKDACLDEILSEGAGKRIEDVTTSNPLERPEWKKRIGENKLGTKSPDHPLYVYHGKQDQTIPYELGTGLRSDWCARGNTVEFTSYPLLDHVPTAALGSGPAMDWLGDRFDGKPAESDCGE